MPADQFGNDLDLLNEDDYDEDYRELCRIRSEDIRYMNGKR